MSVAEQIAAYRAAHPYASRLEIAEAVGCTPQYVGKLLQAERESIVPSDVQRKSVVLVRTKEVGT